MSLDELVDFIELQKVGSIDCGKNIFVDKSLQ